MAYCKKLKKHTRHRVTQYKKGKDKKTAQGNRRYAAKQKGFGGQTKPILKRKAKQTRKITLRLDCTISKSRSLKVIGRCKTFILGADPSKKQGGPIF
jgi:large subunit ribosomal protein L44e